MPDHDTQVAREADGAVSYAATDCTMAPTLCLLSHLGLSPIARDARISTPLVTLYRCPAMVFWPEAALPWREAACHEGALPPWLEAAGTWLEGAGMGFATECGLMAAGGSKGRPMNRVRQNGEHYIKDS